MRLSSAISLANRRGLATRDFNLEDHARYEAIPQFVRDIKMAIGTVYWTQKQIRFSFHPEQQVYDLPPDFGRFLELRPVINGGLGAPMIYEGERPGMVLVADFETACGPSRYHVIHKSTIGSFGPVLPANFGYAYGTGLDWPPTSTTAISTGAAVTVFATYDAATYTYSSGLIRFDTATIPVEATVVGARLHLSIDEPIANADGKIMLVEWYDSWPIDTGDYTTTPIDGAWAGPVARFVQGANSIELLDAQFRINRFGYTGLRLQMDAGATTGTNNIHITAETTLAVDYQLPLTVPFQLKLGAPLDSTYEARGVYNWVIPTAELDPELDAWIPPDIQGLFVKKLRCDILLDAFGQADARYTAERGEYVDDLETLSPMAEAAPKNRVIYVR